MAEPKKASEAFLYADLCHGILPIQVGDQRDFMRGQLVMAALSGLVALVLLVV